MTNDAPIKTKKSPYRASPIGELAPYSWITKPDTQFNQQGVYHGKLILSGDEAKAFLASLDTLVDEAFTSEIEKKPKAKQSKYSKYLPYEEETNEETGEATGRLVITFKQNAKIIPKDTSKPSQDIKIRVEDSQGNEIPGNIFIRGGSKVRFKFSPRTVTMEQSQKIGIRLDFSAIQIIELVTAESNGSRFGAVEGGFVYKVGGSSKPTDSDVAEQAETSSGDY
jgi:hypothetical protein